MTATTSNYEETKYKNGYLLSDGYIREEAYKRARAIDKIFTDDNLKPLVLNALRQLKEVTSYDGASTDSENANIEPSTEVRRAKSVKFDDPYDEISTLFRNDKFMEFSDEDKQTITKYDNMPSSSIMRVVKNTVVKSISDHLMNEVKLKTSDFVFSKVLDPRLLEYPIYNKIIIDLLTNSLDFIGLMLVSIVRNTLIVINRLIENEHVKLSVDYLMSVLGLQFSNLSSVPSKLNLNIDCILSIFGLKFPTSIENKIECNLTRAECIDFNDLKPFICDICEQRFQSCKQLDGHMKNHRETNYRCSVCSHDFAKKHKADTESFHALKNVNNNL